MSTTVPTSADAAPAPIEPRPMGLAARAINVLFAPRQAYDAVVARPRIVGVLVLVIAVIAFKGAWDLYAARAATDAEFKTAKSAAIWAGGLALFSWFALSLMIGAGLFRWGSDGGALALARSFQLGSTAALTILFVNGVRD